MRNTCSYGIAGTNTFRLGSKALFKASRKVFERNEVGTNLQNLSKPCKKIYCVDDPGKRFVQRDQSGAEAKIVAYLCKAGKFRQLFDLGIKPHVFVGLHVFREKWEAKVNEHAMDVRVDIGELIDTPLESLTQHIHWKTVDRLIKSSDNWAPEERYYFIAKQICHSSNYGIGPNRFIENTLEKSQGQVVLTKKQAEFFLDYYHTLFPEIRRWHGEVIAQMRKTRTLRNLQGFPRYFHDDLDQETNKKEWFAFVPQSTVGTITNIAFTQMQQYIEAYRKPWDMLANTHDSYLCQCPAEDVTECNDRMRLYLNATLTTERGEEFQMGSEGAVGQNWGVWHPEKNPLGMKAID